MLTWRLPSGLSLLSSCRTRSRVLTSPSLPCTDIVGCLELHAKDKGWDPETHMEVPDWEQVLKHMQRIRPEHLHCHVPFGPGPLPHDKRSSRGETSQLLPRSWCACLDAVC